MKPHKLAKILEALGLTQTALAQRAGCEQGTISDVCRGRKPGFGPQLAAKILQIVENDRREQGKPEQLITLAELLPLTDAQKRQAAKASTP